MVQNTSRERGQSLVELALSIVFLMVLLAGVTDLGRLFFAWIALRDAAQEGAVYGSIHPTDFPGIESHVRNASDSPLDLTDASTVQVQIQVIGAACAGNAIQVTVTYTFPIATPFIGAIVGGQTFPLSSTVVNTILAPSCD